MTERSAVDRRMDAVKSLGITAGDTIETVWGVKHEVKTIDTQGLIHSETPDSMKISPLLVQGVVEKPERNDV